MKAGRERMTNKKQERNRNRTRLMKNGSRRRNVENKHDRMSDKSGTLIDRWYSMFGLVYSKTETLTWDSVTRTRESILRYLYRWLSHS